MTLPPRIWITRAEPGAARTAARLAALGYAPVVAPLLAVEPLAVSSDDLERALDGATALAFTSPNGVEAFAVLTPRGRDRPVFAVGDATAAAARAAGFVDVLSAQGDLGDLARLIAARRGAADGAILHPRAEQPAGDLGEAVAALVASPPVVHGLAVYRVVETGAAAPEAFDWVLVHSPRGGRALAAVLALGAAPSPFRIAAISPAAAAPLAALEGAARPAGLVIAARPDEDALLTTLGKPPARV